MRGKNPISDDAMKMQVDTSEFLETMELWLRWLDNRIIFDHPGENQVWGVREEYRHAKNNVAFEHQGVYRIPTIRQQQAPPFEVVHVPLHPVGKVKSAINGGWNSVVFKTTPERQQAASQVTLWLSEPDGQVEHMIRAITIPISQKGLDHPKLRETLSQDAQFRGFVDLAPYGWRWPGLPSYSKITGRIWHGRPGHHEEEGRAEGRSGERPARNTGHARRRYQDDAGKPRARVARSVCRC